VEGSKNFAFTFNPSNMRPGWRKITAGNLSDGETCPTCFVFRYVPGMAMPKWQPVIAGSYSLSQYGYHAWRWAPTEYKPRLAPLAPRTYTPFSDARKSFRTELLVPGASGDVFIDNIDKRGIVSKKNKQSYFFDDLTSKNHPLLTIDGGRGKGVSGMATHIEIGVGRHSVDPDSPIMDNVYLFEAKSVRRVSVDGSLVTLAGLYHEGMGSYFGDQPGFTERLAGDWSLVPAAYVGFIEIWGAVFDPDSVLVDVGAQPIPEEQDRQPHIGNPVLFVVDSQRHCIYRLEFDGRSHKTPVKITVMSTWLNDPFDIRYWKGDLIVSERSMNRIVVIDKRTGELKRVLVERDPSLPGNASLAKNGYRRMWRSGTLEECQRQSCLGPEGLYILGDWLYWGSVTQEQIRRVHLDTGEVQVYMKASVDGNSKFVKIALSDGTFGPYGTVFYQSWSNVNTRTAQMGAYLPDGTFWNYASTITYAATGYGCAVAVGGGRMYTSSSSHGLRLHYAGPAIDKSLFSKGKAEYSALHGEFQWGHYGFGGEESFELPWGRSIAMDYFLETAGHRRALSP
jgi:hypothetical protein